jgi:hypothetical protein
MRRILVGDSCISVLGIILTVVVQSLSPVLQLYERTANR